MIFYSSREPWLLLSHPHEAFQLVNFRQAFCVASLMALITTLLIVLDEFVLPEPMFKTISLNGGGYSSLTSVVGVLLSFRTSQAYNRFWEGAGLVYELFGDLSVSAGNLVAFCHYSEESREKVESFKQLLVRLVSLLSAMMLTELEGRDTLNHTPYEMLDLSSLEPSLVKSLPTKSHKAEVVFQWIKGVIVENIKTGVLDIPAPILTRVFQELDNCMSKYHSAEKFSKVPFPFPYVATMEVIMGLHALLTPIAVMDLVQGIWLPIPMVSLLVFMFWSLHLIAGELENPYDGDANDLDLASMQVSLNHRLWTVVMVDRVPRLMQTSKAAADLLLRPTVLVEGQTRMRKLGRSKLEELCHGVYHLDATSDVANSNDSRVMTDSTERAQNRSVTSQNSEMSALGFLHVEEIRRPPFPKSWGSSLLESNSTDSVPRGRNSGRKSRVALSSSSRDNGRERWTTRTTNDDTRSAASPNLPSFHSDLIDSQMRRGASDDTVLTGDMTEGSTENRPGHATLKPSSDSVSSDSSATQIASVGDSKVPVMTLDISDTCEGTSAPFSCCFANPFVSDLKEAVEYT